WGSSSRSAWTHCFRWDHASPIDASSRGSHVGKVFATTQCQQLTDKRAAVRSVRWIASASLRVHSALTSTREPSDSVPPQLQSCSSRHCSPLASLGPWLSDCLPPRLPCSGSPHMSACTGPYGRNSSHGSSGVESQEGLSWRMLALRASPN